MFLVYTVICCIPFVFVSEGRTVQGILGRNVSFSWIFKNIKRDSFSISHGSSPFLTIWPLKGLVVPFKTDERLRVSLDNSTYETVTVTVSISSIRENDTGIYKLERRWDAEDFNDSVFLEIFDKANLPSITLARHVIMDSSIELQCNSSSISTGKFTWSLNESLIERHGRYSQNNTLLSIKNVTADDKYNLYTCNEIGSGFASDPYRLNISGPNVVMFESNVTVANEHEGLNLFCHADCYPICTWNLTKLNLSSAQKKVISADNELQINNITREDAGKYSCKVYNIITGTSLEGFTYLDVVYGPDEIHFNISETIIQLDEFETISLFCYADCFPPCQIGWIETHTRTLIPGSELKLDSVKIDVNCTCHATNPMKISAMISSTIYIKVRSGVNYFTTTTLTARKDTDITDFPSIRHFLYLGLGMGVILAVGLLACLLHKFRACSHVVRTSNNSSFAHSNKSGGNENPQEEHQSGNYWTIVSNAEGELLTAIETHNAQCYMRTPPDIKEMLNQNKLKHSIGTNDVNAAVELEEYLELEEYVEPIHSDSVEHDDYIHPVHSHHVETDFLPRHHTSEV